MDTSQQTYICTNFKIESEKQMEDVIKVKDNVEVLNFMDQKYVDDKYVRDLFSSEEFPRLRTISLLGTSITLKTVDYLEKCKNINFENMNILCDDDNSCEYVSFHVIVDNALFMYLANNVYYETVTSGLVSKFTEYFDVYDCNKVCHRALRRIFVYRSHM